MIASIHILLLNWNNAPRTIQCWKGLKKWQQLPPNILIIDNNSHPKDRTILKNNIPQNQLILNPINGGFAGGNNLGIQKALSQKADFILLLNTDTNVSEETLIQLMEQLKKNPKLGAVSPAIQEGSKDNFKFLIGGRDIAHFSVTRIEKKQQQLTQLPDYPLHFVDYVSGTIFLARAECFKKVGLLNENYFFSGEIADFCQRLKKIGFERAVDVTAVAQHFTDKTENHLRNELYAYYNMRNRFLYIREHYQSKKFRLMFFWMFQAFRQMPGILWNRNWKQLRAIMLGTLHGLVGRFGNQNSVFLKK